MPEPILADAAAESNSPGSLDAPWTLRACIVSDLLAAEVAKNGLPKLAPKRASRVKWALRLADELIRQLNQRP